MDKNSELTPIKISKLPALSIAALVFSMALPGTATAMSSVTLDGILTDANEYTGGVENGSREILWFNDHNSIYTVAANNKNTLLWEINEVAGGTFSLNVFFEVPAEARRMIWDNDCTYNGTLGSGCAALAPLEMGVANEDYLDAYLAGSHHGDVKMDYGTQVGSEYFRLNGEVNPDSKDGDKDAFLPIFDRKWTDESGGGDNPMWANSRE